MTKRPPYRPRDRYKNRYRETARSWGQPLTDEQRAAGWTATREQIHSAIQRARLAQTVRSS